MTSVGLSRCQIFVASRFIIPNPTRTSGVSGANGSRQRIILVNSGRRPVLKRPTDGNAVVGDSSTVLRINRMSVCSTVDFRNPSGDIQIRSGFSRSFPGVVRQFVRSRSGSIEHLPCDFRGFFRATVNCGTGNIRNQLACACDFIIVGRAEGKCRIRLVNSVAALNRRVMNCIVVPDEAPGKRRVLHAVVPHRCDKIVAQRRQGSVITRAFKINQTVFEDIAVLPAGVIDAHAALFFADVVQKRVARCRIAPHVLTEVGVGLNRHVRVHHAREHGSGSCGGEKCCQRDSNTP